MTQLPSLRTLVFVSLLIVTVIFNLDRLPQEQKVDLMFQLGIS